MLAEMYSSHTPFPEFLHLPSINKTCATGDINSTNLLVNTALFVSLKHVYFLLEVASPLIR